MNQKVGDQIIYTDTLKPEQFAGHQSNQTDYFFIYHYSYMGLWKSVMACTKNFTTLKGPTERGDCKQ